MDEVTIAPDMNNLVKLIVERNFTTDFKPKAPLSIEAINELNLAYVAASRARVALHEAKFLDLDFYNFQTELGLDYIETT